MKKKIIFLLFIFGLTSCQPKITPTPEIREITRVVEQTVEIPQIVKETVMVTELVEAPPTVTVSDQEQFELKPEYFDAMLALTKFFNYLDTKECEAYYESFSQHRKPSNINDLILYCEKAVGNVEVVSIYPFNYQIFLEGSKHLAKEPKDTIYLSTIVLWEELNLGEMLERKIYFYVEMVWEDNEWKVNSTNTDPFSHL